MALVSRSMTGAKYDGHASRDQVPHGDEGTGHSEYRVAAGREVGGGSLVHRSMPLTSEERVPKPEKLGAVRLPDLPAESDPLGHDLDRDDQQGSW